MFIVDIIQNDQRDFMWFCGILRVNLRLIFTLSKPSTKQTRPPFRSSPKGFTERCHSVSLFAGMLRLLHNPNTVALGLSVRLKVWPQIAKLGQINAGGNIYSCNAFCLSCNVLWIRVTNMTVCIRPVWVPCPPLTVGKLLCKETVK